MKQNQRNGGHLSQLGCEVLDGRRGAWETDTLWQHLGHKVSAHTFVASLMLPCIAAARAISVVVCGFFCKTTEKGPCTLQTICASRFSKRRNKQLWDEIFLSNEISDMNIAWDTAFKNNYIWHPHQQEDVGAASSQLGNSIWKIGSSWEGRHEGGYF